MILAIVLAAQVSAGTPNPCSDQLATLCRISPYFCPGAYPDGFVPGTGNVPCWPERNPVMALARRGMGSAREPARIGVRDARPERAPSNAVESPSIIQRIKLWMVDRFGADTEDPH